MTVYYQTLSLQYLSTNPTPTTLNISSSDTIELGIDTSSYADGNGWLRYGTPVGCTTSATSGADGQAVVITPNVGATSYSVTFRTLISETSTYYYGRIAGTISTGTSDTTPDAFTFTDQTNVALSSTITSNTITVSGINAASAISISGGTYSINGGAYTSSSGTVTNGQTVSVQHTSSASNSTATNTTLTIGGVSDTFTSTTAAAAATYTLSFYDATFASARTNFNEGELVYAAFGTTAADGTYYWSTSSGSDLVSPVSGSFSVSAGFGLPSFTIASDSLTEGTETLTFYVRSGSVSGTVLTSSSITINDTSTAPAPTPTYSVANASTNEGASATVNVTTTNVANGTTLYWTVSGADVSTTSGSFTISSNAGSFTIPAIADSTTEGTEYYTISIRTGSTGGSVVASSTLTIFDTSTTAADTTPNQFTFTDQTNVALNTVITSNAITVSGINAASGISVSGGTYSINGGAYTSSSGTVTNGQTVTVRHTSSGSNSTATNTTLTIGGVSDVFTSTTVAAAPDTTPNQFIFSNQSGVPVSSTIVSSEVQIFGINTGAPVSISGGEYSIAIDPTTYTIYTSSPGTIYNGQSIKVRHTSSASNNTNTSTTLTIGGVSDTFISTTIGASGSGLYGLQIFDEFGNITLDTTDNTIKDFGYFSVASVTTNGTLTSVPMTTNSIALVTNNNGDGDTAIAPAVVTLDPPTSSIVVSGGSSGFDISIRLMEF